MNTAACNYLVTWLIYGSEFLRRISEKEKTSKQKGKERATGEDDMIYLD